MGSLFSTPDTGAQEARLKKQEDDLARKEKLQANELAARRRSQASGSQSKTLFSAVEGIGDSAKAKKTVLGG